MQACRSFYFIWASVDTLTSRQAWISRFSLLSAMLMFLNGQANHVFQHDEAAHLHQPAPGSCLSFNKKAARRISRRAAFVSVFLAAIRRLNHQSS
ncbi:hypothetical protein [Desulfonatronospira thiodismutans]|uniref:hypothetical protein n=1 Tax=Desulfonatronospira thiodismutans TaxID=488939 RepID=UPI00118503E3|nr:hypothetical protein [Desulfonatronospira thiodismutans]